MYKKLSNPAYCLYFSTKSDMKIFWKMIGISVLCSLFFLGCMSKASTGDTLGTWSNLGTWGTSTGTVSTGITIGYTWSLITYLDAQERSLSSWFSSTYAKLYTLFSKTWLNILKSIEYQSLVCFWAIKNESLLSQLQKDRTLLTISFKKDFIELENQILALEEKKNLQESDGVNVFDAWTTYETEKIRLKNLIDDKVKLHRGFITNFETSYITKNTEFLSNFQQYSLANKDLIKGIHDKMAKVQGVLAAFSGVETAIDSINAKITGLDDLIKKMDDVKTKGVANLNTILQPLIDTNAKKYKTLRNLVDELTTQKVNVINQYQTDFDEYLNTNFQSRYNRSQYLALKTQINNYQSKFYTVTNQLNCSNILSTTDESAALLTKITTMSIAIHSWLAKIDAEGISTTFKDQLYSGFQSLYVQKFKQRYTEYTNYLKEYIKSALKNLVSSLVPTINTGSITPLPTQTPIKYVFTKPFKSNEYNEGIKALQNLLTNLQLYSWAIDGVYTKATKNAVYQFQLSKWLLKGYEKKPDVWWWMGPATRNALNKLTK